MNVAVIGYSGDVERPIIKRISDICVALGELIAQKGHNLLTGGRDGVMELVSKGASQAGGKIIGILPFDEAGNEYNNLTINTGMDYLMRSLVLIRSADLVISIGGEIGTLYEIISAYACGKTVVLFRGTGGWTDKIVPSLIDGKFLDNRRIVEIFQVTALEQLDRFLA
ncbi:MAG: TIGR00725 family protein [Kosmotoga sp.]|uniref:TIGR00725 family protein n=1 Tax=Kosmotoga sp. TaxID=1955248 RepID=UPI001DBFF3EB|nr:TIGR00725 family protein [Kosmotoga sp.]MBO8166069.1 TIGR00725 family protein [Kosmotoga sp.]